MENSKFSRLFNTLTEKEKSKFYQFSILMYESQYRQLRLLKYLYKHLRSNSLLNLSEAYREVFQKSLSGKVSKKNFSNLLSDLTRWLENFLLCKWTEVNQCERTLFIKHIYIARGLQTDYLTTLRHTKSKVLQTPNSYKTPLNIFLLNDFLYFGDIKDKHLADQELLDTAINYLEEFFWVARLKMEVELLSRDNLLPNKKRTNILNQELLKIKKYPKTSLVYMYYSLYQLIIIDNDEIFENFKDLVYKFSTKDKISHLSFLLYAINYSARKIRLVTDVEYITATLNFYKFGIDKKLLIANGYFEEMAFINIVNLSSYLKELKWVSSFIHEWSKYLPYSIREELTKLSKGRILFEEEEYLKAIEMLSLKHFRNAYYNVESRILKIRSLIELGWDVKSEKECAALEGFIRRNKEISDSFRKSCLNFLKIARKLIYFFNKEELLEILNDMDAILCKNWIIAKINKC